MGTPVDNWHNADPVMHGEQLEAQDLKGRYPAALHRPTQPCYTYNCHGLTFAARRTAISSPAEVRKVLAEDGYSRVFSVADVAAGDIAIYVSADGDIEHSGIVVETAPGMLVPNPKILSKWGNAHEVIHLANYSPYIGSSIQYFRIES